MAASWRQMPATPDLRECFRVRISGSRRSAPIDDRRASQGQSAMTSPWRLRFRPQTVFRSAGAKYPVRLNPPVCRNSGYDGGARPGLSYPLQPRELLSLRRLVFEHQLRIAERQNSIWPRAWSRCRAHHIVREQNIIMERKQHLVSLPACVLPCGVRIADPSEVVGPAHQGKTGIAAQIVFRNICRGVRGCIIGDQHAQGWIGWRGQRVQQSAQERLGVLGGCQGEHAALAGHAERLIERWITAGQKTARS